MNWQNQSQEFIRSWTEAQGKIWETWQSSFQTRPQALPPTEMWTRAVETWERAIDSAWDAQAQVMEMWRSGTDKMTDAPDDVKAQAKQVQDMMESWSRMQRKLWDNWVTGLKNADAAKMGEAWQTYGAEFSGAMQEHMDQVMAAQKELIERFSNKVSKKK